MPYNLNDLYKAIQNPLLVRGELRKYGQRFNRLFHQKFYSEDGIDVTKEQWDNLIILDGCRSDTFNELHELSGESKSIISCGSTSWEFMKANFQEKRLHDTVYVTTNPHIYRLNDGIFHSVVDLLKNWDEDLQTVPPSEIVTASEEIVSKYPNKKYIFHFMQPHYPFIGETGKEIDHRGHEKNVDSPELNQPNIWEVLQWGKNPTVTEEKVWKAYKENLQIVLQHVKELLEIVDGRTVITADHGNLIGDRLRPIPVRGYGHPSGLRAPELVSVPWHIIDSDNRREIIAEPPLETQSRDEDDVVDQLAALGYAD